jgi:aryl-alcohol dehydrogenase-like predicted oxidoreductase
MKYRTLGASGLKVSQVGIGCNNFGLRMEIEASQAVIHKALDLGITLFDTADVYGNKGGSETALGRYLGDRRKDIVIATKFGNPMNAEGTLRGASRRYIMTAVEASLKRLNTDWIDIYQLHKPDPDTPVEETLFALDDLVRQGKIRYYGCSGAAAWQLVRMHWTARMNRLTPIVSGEMEYSLLHREPEREHVAAMLAHGIGLLPYYPLAGGFLSGKYQRGDAMPPGARLTRFQRYSQRYMTEANWTIVENLQAFGKARGKTLLDVAIAWLAAQPVVSSIIAGATKAEQLEQNVDAARWELSQADLAEIDRLCGVSDPQEGD